MEQARRDPRITLFVVFYPPGAEADDWSDGTTIHAESIGSYIRPYGADTFMTEAGLATAQTQRTDTCVDRSHLGRLAGWPVNAVLRMMRS